MAEKGFISASIKRWYQGDCVQGLFWTVIFLMILAAGYDFASRMLGKWEVKQRMAQLYHSNNQEPPKQNYGGCGADSNLVRRGR